jgi:hypothetical protein
VRVGKSGMVTISLGLMQAERRFAIAHELGHFELHKSESYLGRVESSLTPQSRSQIRVMPENSESACRGFDSRRLHNFLPVKRHVPRERDMSFFENSTASRDGPPRRSQSSGGRNSRAAPQRLMQS